MNPLATQTTDVQLPAWAVGVALTPDQQRLKDAINETGSVQVPRISVDNGQFHFEADGVPVSMSGPITTAVIAFMPRPGRDYYDGPYVKGESARPACYSLDGVTPENDSPNRQADTCRTCPQSQKGSKVVNGQPMTACSLSQSIMVSIPNRIGDPAALYKLRVNATSLFAKSVEPGYMGFTEYLAWFRQRIAQGAVVFPQYALTEISMVPHHLAEAPSHIRFRITGWLPEAHAKAAAVEAEKPLTLQYLWGPNGPKTPSAIALLPAPPQAAPPQAAPPQAAPPVQQAPVQQAPVQQAPTVPQQAATPQGFDQFAAGAQAAAPQQPVAATRPGRGRARPMAPVAPQQTAAPTQGFGAPTQGFGAPVQQGAPAGFATPPGPTSAAATGFGGFADVQPS